VRLAASVAGLLGTAMLMMQYFILLPPFAWLANRAARREKLGWTSVAPEGHDSPTSQY
jgi:hypothetical protein